MRPTARAGRRNAQSTNGVLFLAAAVGAPGGWRARCGGGRSWWWPVMCGGRHVWWASCVVVEPVARQRWDDTGRRWKTLALQRAEDTSRGSAEADPCSQCRRRRQMQMQADAGRGCDQPGDAQLRRGPAPASTGAQVQASSPGPTQQGVCQGAATLRCAVRHHSRTRPSDPCLHLHRSMAYLSSRRP